MEANTTQLLRCLVLKSLALVGALGIALPTLAAAPMLWRDVDQGQIVRTAQARQIVPQAYRNTKLDRVRLAALLAQTPQESTIAVSASTIELALPLTDGRYSRFQIVEAPVMAAELASLFPEIRTYIGQGLDDPTATLRFDMTPAGFHAQIIAAEGSTYIDPYQPGDVDHYIVYRKLDAQKSGARPMCLVTGDALSADASGTSKRNQAVNLSSGTSMRNYRVAIAATGEYSAFHGGTVAGAMNAIVTTLNRVVGIYERDLSVRMTLIANNNLVIYTDAGTDPYSNDDGFAMLGQNQTILDTIIGSSNYDIGHVVSTGGGGVAGLGVVCSASQKGRGVTGSPAPVGDPFDVDYVAHEMGHQFGGNHTFNSSSDNCGGGNRSASSAYEVGSGLTIQAYAGICAPDDLQGNSAPYFHRRSLNEMLAFTTSAGSGASCGTVTATGNTPPLVSTPAAFTIPGSTPFTLTASGSDADGNSLTYLWEQFDLGPTNPSGMLTDNGGPLFRNYSPITNPSRTFPSLPFILNNANVPPQTTGSFLTGELLPSSNRTLHFRVTARDNRAGGGGTNEATTSITVNAASGPFAVTSPNTAVTWGAATAQTITWNVAGTNAAPVSTATVTISLSLDGGNTFPLTLATGEVNDGSATLNLVGATPSSQARIRVAAENNVYFDISDSNFTITGSGGTQPMLSQTTQLLTTGNALIEPNECNNLSVTLINSGTTAATAVSAVLTSNTPNVTISQSNSAFPDIPVGQSRSNTTAYQISTGSALVCFTNINLTLTVSYSGGGSPYVSQFSLPVGQSAGGGNYSFASSNGATFPAGGTLVAGSQSDDAVVNLTVPAGFNFSVYGTTVNAGSTLRVSTNGNLQIVGSNGSSEWSNGAMPSDGSENGAGSFPAALPVLMPYWDDLDTSNGGVTGGGVYQQITGSAPNRKWIVEWRGELVGAAGNAISVNFAIEFKEASNEFSYVYAQTGGSNGASATIGVQAATTGNSFTQFSLDSASVVPGQRLTATLPVSICSAGSGACGAGDPLFANGFESP